MEYLLAAIFLIALATAYVLGYDFIAKRVPDYLPQYVLAMSVTRLILSATFAGVVILYLAKDSEAMPFGITYIIMYITMVGVTFFLRH